MVFGRNSIETRICESLPVVGLIASAVHAGAGNHDHAKRAAAKNLNSCLGVAGAVGGGLVGGPAGAMAGGAALAGAGRGCEAGIADKRISDEAAKRHCAKHTVDGYFMDAGLGGVSGAIGNVGGLVGGHFAPKGARGVGKFVGSQVLAKAHTVPPQVVRG